MLALSVFFAGLALAGTLESCPANGPLSCHNTTTVTNLCCFNAPGGALLQTQFWDTSPSTGPSNSWTIHGLWPDNCDGTYEENCDSSRAYTDISGILTSFGKADLLNYMNIYWLNDPNDGSNEELWEHEWATHGTCISTLDTTCYSNYTPMQEVPDFFQTVVDVFQNLPTYTWLSNAGITPSSSKTYTLSAIQSALTQGYGFSVYIGCSSGALNQVYYYFNVQGSVQTGTFVPAAAIGSTSNCGSSGIQYLPKSGASSVSSSAITSSSSRSSSSTAGSSSTSSSSTPSSSPTTFSSTPSSSPTSSSASPSSTSGSGSFSGKGYLNVNYNGAQDGCVISAGTWYTTGTCATFTATASGSGFTLASSKGKCVISNSVLTCSSSVNTATVFTAVGGNLAAGGSTSFYASAVASGSTQETIYTSSHSISLNIT